MPLDDEYRLAAANQLGPSSEKGKPQKRKLAASSSKEGEDGVVKCKKRRKNDVPNEEGDPQDRCVKLVILLYLHSDVVLSGSSCRKEENKDSLWKT